MMLFLLFMVVTARPARAQEVEAAFLGGSQQIAYKGNYPLETADSLWFNLITQSTNQAHPHSFLWADQNSGLWLYHRKSDAAEMYIDPDARSLEPVNIYLEQAGRNRSQVARIGQVHPDNFPGRTPQQLTIWRPGNGSCWMRDGEAMWKWSPTDSLWIPMLRDTAEQPVYGRLGEYDALYQAGSWSDLAHWEEPAGGGLWLLKGHDGSAHQSRRQYLWRFDTQRNQWALMDSLGDSSEWPPLHHDASSWWGLKGRLWLFGGLHFTTNSASNVMWRYDIAERKWQRIQANRTFRKPSQKGSFRADNQPRARSSAMQWTDNDGKLWLFGGDAFFEIAYQELRGYSMNDLWVFDPQIEKWAWMGGALTAVDNGHYTRTGQPDSTAWPRARHGADAFVDAQGRLLLGYGVFSGEKVNRYDRTDGLEGMTDIWRYDPQTQQWTWLLGPENGSRGEQRRSLPRVGDTSMPLLPGGSPKNAIWMADNGDLWLYHYVNFNDATNNIYGYTPEAMTAFWKYDRSAKKWIFQSGERISSFFQNRDSIVYASEDSTPLNLINYHHWQDKKGRFWLLQNTAFESEGDYLNIWYYDQAAKSWTFHDRHTIQTQVSDRDVADPLNAPGYLRQANTWTDNEGRYVVWQDGMFWRYQPQDKVWVWFAGDTSNVPRSTQYGPRGQEDPEAHPGDRIFDYTWMGRDGHFWAYGGKGGFDAPSMWRFNPKSNQWAWMGGDTVLSHIVRAAKGVAADSLHPGCRDYGVTWRDRRGKLWIYGGYLYYNQDATDVGQNVHDLWSFDTQTLQWSWVAGDTSLRSPRYPPEDGAWPGSRYYASKPGRTMQDSVVFFGGISLANASNSRSVYNTADLWMLRNPNPDQTPPYLRLRDDTLYLGDARGWRSLIDSIGDRYGIADTSLLDSNAFSCENLGAFPIRIRATDYSGNTTVDTALVTVLDTSRPTVRIQGDSVVCTKTEASLGWYYEASDNCPVTVIRTGGPPSSAALSPGRYTVSLQATDLAGNTGIASRTFILQAHPSASFSIAKENRGKTLQLKANEADLWRYRWLFSGGDTAAGPEASYTFEDYGRYRIRLSVEDHFGCRSQQSEEVVLSGLATLCQLSDAFSPDGDGHNDRWGLQCEAEVESVQLTVFMRNKAKVFQSEAPGLQWDGRGPEGEALPAGLYPYRACWQRNPNGPEHCLRGQVRLLR